MKHGAPPPPDEAFFPQWRRNPGLPPLLALTQGVYYLASGLWPLVSIFTFQLITGPKDDIWLVRTVGALVIVCSAVLLLAASRRRIAPEAALLGFGYALALMAVEIFYVLAGTISPVYLLDTVIEAVFAAGWVIGAMDTGMYTRPAPAP
jgi:hypothetical protein